MITSRLLAGLVLLLWGAILRTNGQTACTNDNPTQAGPCVSLSGTLCDQFYSHTFFPNNVTSDQVNAASFFSFYEAFYTDVVCTPLATLYTCLALYPACDAQVGSASLRPPCRSLCLRVVDDCSLWLQARGRDLDIQCLVIDCDRYPEEGCVGLEDPMVADVLATAPPPPDANRTDPTPTSNGTEPPPDGMVGNLSNRTDPTPTSNGTEPPDEMVGNLSDTCPPQNLNFFKSQEENFAKIWVAFWSVLCFVSTLTTILTFALNPSRIEYPWRPVIYLAVSFNIHSIGYFFALAFGRDLVTCPGDEFVQTNVSWSWAHTPCILVFCLLYYSIMAAFLWWLILTFSWFLASVFKWSNEGISHLSPFFHIVSWVVPLLLTISLLAARVVAADELTATCFVVRDDHTASFVALLVGIIIPISLIIITGIVFLCIGFASALRIHSFMRHEQKQRESRILEKLMIRVSIFVTVYIIPAVVILACFIYELDSRPDWTPLNESCSDCTRPNTAIFMVRIFMSLLIGILTGVWIWSKKTIQSWKGVPKRVSGCVQGTECCEGTVELQPTTDSDITNAYSMERKSNRYASESIDSS